MRVCVCVCEFMYSQLTVNWSMRGEAPPLGTVKNEVVKCLQMSTSVCVYVCVCVSSGLLITLMNGELPKISVEQREQQQSPTLLR